MLSIIPKCIVFFFSHFRSHRKFENQESEKKLVRTRLRRPTNLKIDGQFFHITEHADKFIKYLLGKRAELLRTPTTLKLEGTMETKTETAEKYIKYDILERPSLCKKFTQLHLEGDLDNNTEKREKFVPFEVQKRPPLMKKSTNLHLEGDLTLIPEYTHEYVNYGSLERPKPAIPVNHLKPGGVFENVNNNDKSSEDRLHPAIPFLRDSYKRTLDDDLKRRTPSKLSREQSFVKSDENLINNIRKPVTYPNIIFTKASDSDISRISSILDIPNRSQERVSSRQPVQRQSVIDSSRKATSPNSTYMKNYGKNGCVDTPIHSRNIVTSLRRIEDNVEIAEVSKRSCNTAFVEI